MADPVSLVAGPVVKIIASLTSSFIKEQYHLIYGVGDEVVKLESNLSAIQAALIQVEGKLSETDLQSLRDWLIKLKDAALDVQDVLEIYATKAFKMSQKKRRVVLSPLLKREAALNIKKIAQRINEISEERKNFHHFQNQNEARMVDHVFKRYGLQQTGSSRDSSDICGRDKEKEKIIKWMLSKESEIQGEVCVLPIIGMGGLGKTTLAQLVYNDDRVKTHFEHRIWVDVTIRFNLEKIGKEITEGLIEKHHTFSNWCSIVKQIEKVLKGKCFLLVLDDLWNERFTDWDKLRQVLKQGRGGSRVLITSRISGIGKIVAARNNHFLDLLPEEACWSLFANIAFTGDQEPSSSQIPVIGRQIVQKCHGLPLAVTAMAILLRGCTDVHRWQRILSDGVWGTELNNAANGETNILPGLRLSYDHLPSHLKQCFAYCCIFPKGHTFDRSDLIKLWMAEGFIDSSGRSLPEETGRDYFEELRSRSFFQLVDVDGREGYRVHDFLLDLATLVSGQSCEVVNDKILSNANRCRYVSFVSEDVQKPASEILKVKKLRTFLLPTNKHTDFGQALDKMFNTLEYLRVLDLSSSTLIELPKSIENLQLLRYFDLSQTEIRKLPQSVCNLINLQTLKLLKCLWLSELPEGLDSLTSLRHLELDDMFWYKCSSLPAKMGNLTNLQNLHSFPVVQESGCGLEQLRSLKYLAGKLRISHLENAKTAADANLREKGNLQELVLEWSEEQACPQDPTVEERILGELEPHSNIEGLQICHYKGSQLPTWMVNESLRNLSKVSFSYCANIKSFSSGLLCHVMELNIKGMLELEEWTEAGNSNLKLLKIRKCPKLRSLPSSFQKLKVMKIKSCDMLKSLPVTPSLKSLLLIDNAALENWQKEAFSATETSKADGGFESELRIVNCPKLTDLALIFQPCRLEISNCPLLKSISFPQQNECLKHVALIGCSGGSLVEAIPSSISLHSLVLSNIANLISLPVTLQLPGLKALYIHECADFTSFSNENKPLRSFTSLMLLSVSNCPRLNKFVDSDSGLPLSLEHLSIKKCSNLESLGPQKCLLPLVALKDFYLEDCPILKSFPEDGPPSSLEHLRIQGCPLLSQSLNNGGPYSQMMAHIADLEIDST